MLAILCIGASVSASSFFWQPPSPCAMLAERLHMTVDYRAHSGKTIADMMPTDAELVAAPIVMSWDGFYWFSGYKEGCDQAVSAADHLFAVRGNRQMILATVPGGSDVRDCINPVLRERCNGACILLEPPPFAGLHPPEAYLRQMVEEAFSQVVSSAPVQ